VGYSTCIDIALVGNFLKQLCVVRTMVALDNLEQPLIEGRFSCWKPFWMQYLGMCGISSPWSDY